MKNQNLSKLKKENELNLTRSVKLSKNGITFTDNVSYNDWVKIGDKLRLMEGSVQFWIGDWLNYGENNYDKWTQEFDPEKNYDYGYLSNMKWVARRVDISRRRENLSWSHHQTVADLEPADQDLLLQEAEDHHLNRTKFRKLVYSYKKKLDVPEMTAEQIEKIQTAHPDFDVVQPTVMTCADLLDQIDRISFNALVPNARDYLLSVMKDAVSKMGEILLRYDKNK